MNVIEKSSPREHHIIGESAWAREIRESIRRVASHDASILITGPSGTGKEMIARSIHACSCRGDEAFVPVDCAAAASSLWASQLFGHVKGAFTGANYESLGCFRSAEGGTLFFDEVGELAPHLQCHLLRVLQERRVIPVGTHQSYPVDVRVIAATNRDLATRVKAGTFRLDLYFRLNVVTLATTPLCQRVEDIEPLTRHFLDRLTVRIGSPRKWLSPDAMAKLRDYDWPGNIRELQNTLERAVVFSDGELIGQELLSFEPQSSSAASAPHEHAAYERDAQHFYPPCGDTANYGNAASQHWKTLAEHEAAYLLKTLEHTHYNQSAAARLLNINRQLLRRKLKKYRLV